MARFKFRPETVGLVVENGLLGSARYNDGPACAGR